MPPVTKTLSPAELAKLEHAFATDPASEAYKPLAEAYLGMGRFMEAMVVCKKGVKAHPALPDPRVLLARVYAEQGKDKKAMEELQGALQVSPTDKIALRMMGALQVKGGEPEAGKANLLKAWEADPADTETTELMQKYGVPVPKPAAPEPPPPPPPAPVAAQAPAGAIATSGLQQPSVMVDPPASVMVSPSMQVLPQVAEAPPAATAQPAPAAPQRPAAQAPATKPKPKPKVVVQPRAAARPVDDDEEPEVSDVRPAKKAGGSSKALFFLLIFAVPVSAAAYYGIGQYRANRIRQANALLREATTLVKSDTFKGYEQAIAKAEEALNLDASADTSRNARGLLAFSYTVRWGEHIHDESNRENAEKHIKAGNEAKEASALLHAADALFSFYNNKTDEGLKAIEARIQAAEADKKQVSIYYLTRGTLQMNEGDLEGAKESLDRAQSIAPDDPRVYVAQGNLHRRRGNDVAALSAFNNALKYTRNSHPEGLIGTANLILDQENPGNGYCLAAKYVKTLSDMADGAAPRQLATNAFVKALLISRVSKDIPLFKDATFQKTLEECTGVKPDEAQARKDITAAENDGLSLDRNNPELLLIKGRRLAWEGNLDGAATELRKAIEGNPQASHFHVELAKVLMKKEGGEAAAEEALKKALSLVPASPKLLAMLGQVQYRQKKFDAARDTLDKAVADPKAKNPEARFLLGKLYRDEKKDYAKAAELLKKAGEEYYSDPSMAAAAYDELGVTLEQKGDKDGARANYEKALNADREYAAAYCHYGLLLSKDGKEKEKAKEIAKEYLKLAPREACAEDMKRLAGG
jgi:tetratricopeptide (TPR) repeat protein